ncbi:Uncharacterised protein [Sphingobacterium daejeonense]|nr:Uncharacterised protein [Sphingobacterium daejeonense]
MSLRNSLSLGKEETDRLLAEGAPHTIRIKMPHNEVVSFERHDSWPCKF